MQTNSNYQKTQVVRIQLSKHAQVRTAQRAISPLVLPLITSYGKREFDGRGGVRYMLTSSTHRQLVRAVGDTPQVRALAGCFVVLDALSQSTVITCGHRQ